MTNEEQKFLANDWDEDPVEVDIDRDEDEDVYPEDDEDALKNN